MFFYINLSLKLPIFAVLRSRSAGIHFIGLNTNSHSRLPRIRIQAWLFTMTVNFYKFVLTNNKDFREFSTSCKTRMCFLSLLYCFLDPIQRKFTLWPYPTSIRISVKMQGLSWSGLTDRKRIFPSFQFYFKLSLYEINNIRKSVIVSFWLDWDAALEEVAAFTGSLPSRHINFT